MVKLEEGPRLFNNVVGVDNDAVKVETSCEGIVTRDPQVARRGHWIKLDHPEMGNSIYNAGPFRSRRMPPGASRPAPLLGQHTQEVCAELRDLDAA